MNSVFITPSVLPVSVEEIEPLLIKTEPSETDGEDSIRWETVSENNLERLLTTPETTLRETDKEKATVIEAPVIRIMSVKYSPADKDTFFKMLAKYPIIENKKTDAYNIEKKKEAWDKIVNEYNLVASEQRSVIQLKRLWDKMKRKSALADKRCEIIAPYKPPSPPPQPKINALASHLDFEIDVQHDSNGLNLNAEVVQTSDEDHLGSSIIAHVNGFEALNEPAPSASPTPAKWKTKHLNSLTEARLKLIKKEEVQMEELHRLRMEEAEFRREAARLVMLQEEAKLKKLHGSLNFM